MPEGMERLRTRGLFRLTILSIYLLLLAVCYRSDGHTTVVHAHGSTGPPFGTRKYLLVRLQHDT